MQDEERRFAYHEAGHCIAYFETESLVDMISIKELGDSAGQTYTSNGRWTDYRKMIESADTIDIVSFRLIIKQVGSLYAGYIAERIENREIVRPLFPQEFVRIGKSGSGGDQADAVALFNEAIPSITNRDAWMRSVFIASYRWATRLLYRQWHNVDLLATELLKKKEMTSDEIFKLLEDFPEAPASTHDGLAL